MANTLNSKNKYGVSFRTFSEKFKGALASIGILAKVSEEDEQNERGKRHNIEQRSSVHQRQYEQRSGSYSGSYDDRQSQRAGMAGDRQAQRQAERTKVAQAEKVPEKKRDTVIIYVNNFERCKEVIRAVMRGSAVIVYLSEVDKATAQRIVDALAGAAFALTANIRKISEGNYLLAPRGMNVDIIRTVKKRYQ